MNLLEKEIAELQRERAAAAVELEIAYRHAKRDVKRTLSPARMIRKHVGVSLGLAAVAGYLMAPAKHVGGEKRHGRIWSWGKKLLGLAVPGMAAKAAEKAEGHEESAPASAVVAPPPPPQRGFLHRGLVTALVAQGVSFLRQNKDIHKILGDMVRGLKRNAASEKKPVVVSSGDGGAIKGVEFELAGKSRS